MIQGSKIRFKRPSGFCTLGNCYVLVINGDIYLSLGPDWLFTIIIISFSFTMLITFIYIMAKEVDLVFQYLGFFIYSLLLVSYMMVSLKNPGIIISPWEIELEETENQEKSMCRKCNVEVEIGSFHCEDCEVCIRKHDHHCPITGKCIGEGNVRWFYVFLTSTVLGISYLGFWIYLRSRGHFL